MQTLQLQTWKKNYMKNPKLQTVEHLRSPHIPCTHTGRCDHLQSWQDTSDSCSAAAAGPGTCKVTRLSPGQCKSGQGAAKALGEKKRSGSHQRASRRALTVPGRQRQLSQPRVCAQNTHTSRDQGKKIASHKNEEKTVHHGWGIKLTDSDSASEDPFTSK